MMRGDFKTQVRQYLDSRRFSAYIAACVFVGIFVVIPLFKLGWYELGTHAARLRSHVGKRVERRMVIQGKPAINRGTLLWAEYRFEFETWGFFCLHISITAEGGPFGTTQNYATSGCIQPGNVDEVRLLD